MVGRTKKRIWKLRCTCAHALPLANCIGKRKLNYASAGHILIEVFVAGMQSMGANVGRSVGRISQCTDIFRPEGKVSRVVRPGISVEYFFYFRNELSVAILFIYLRFVKSRHLTSF